jgi:tryptophan-rich sensory protein
VGLAEVLFAVLAAWLLLPYLLWVVFASYLNFRIWQMN